MKITFFHESKEINTVPSNLIKHNPRHFSLGTRNKNINVYVIIKKIWEINTIVFYIFQDGVILSLVNVDLLMKLSLSPDAQLLSQKCKRKRTRVRLENSTLSWENKMKWFSSYEHQSQPSTHFYLDDTYFFFISKYLLDNVVSSLRNQATRSLKS